MPEELPQRLHTCVLVLRCQLGDVGAFGRLAAQYDAPARYYVQRLLGSTDAVDDVVQETWLAVAKGLRTLRDPNAFAAWFYRIARNKAVERRRQKGALPATGHDDLEAVEDCSEEDAFSAEDAEEIHRALDALAPPHREVLVLRFMEEMSYEEIAEVVGCGPGTVRSRIFYAKRALRKEMAKR